MDFLDYILSNYKLSRVINNYIPSSQFDAYFDNSKSISEGKVNFNLFSKKLILYNYCSKVEDCFENRVLHLINKFFLTRKIEFLEKEIFSLITNSKYILFIETIDPILRFVNYLLFPDKFPLLNDSYLESIALNLHFFIKDSKFPIFLHLDSLRKYFNTNSINSCYTLNSCQRIITTTSEKNIIPNLLFACDQFCGSFCFYFIHNFRFEECKTTIQGRFLFHLKSIQYTKLFKLSRYFIDIVKDFSHMIFHGILKNEQFRAILNEFNLPIWMKDPILCTITTIPYNEIKYMFGIPFEFINNLNDSTHVDFDRFLCFNINSSNFNLFGNLSSCIQYDKIEIKSEEKGTIEEEKEKSRKISQLNKILISKCLSQTFCENLPETFEINDFKTVQCFENTTEFTKYYDKRESLIDKIQARFSFYTRTSIDHIKKKIELMKEQYFEILNCKFINEEDTLCNSIYDWEPEYLIFENDGKDNIHVFTPAEYEQLLSRDMNFYNRQPLSLVNKFKIQNRVKSLCYSVYPRLQLLNAILTHNYTDLLNQWLFNTYKDLHEKMTLYYLSMIRSEYGCKFSNDRTKNIYEQLLVRMFPEVEDIIG